jgi:putative transposase
MAQAHAQRRHRASARYLAGDPLEDICREVACATSWLYTWRERSLAPDPSWSAALSRRPRTTPTKTPHRLAQVVVALRQTLAQHGQGCGAASIPQALVQQGIEPVPSPRTLYRILHRDAKAVLYTTHRHTSVPQRGQVLPVWTWPHRQGQMAT